MTTPSFYSVYVTYNITELNVFNCLNTQILKVEVLRKNVVPIGHPLMLILLENISHDRISTLLCASIRLQISK